MKTIKPARTASAPAMPQKTVKTGLLKLLLLLIPSLSFAIEPPGGLRGTATEEGTIKWEWSASNGAARYDVIVNREFVKQTSDTHFYSRGLSAGEYTLVVKAISSDWQYSKPSKPAKRRLNSGGGSVVPTTLQATKESDAKANSNGESSISAPRDPRGTEVRDGVMKWEWAKVSGAVFVSARLR